MTKEQTAAIEWLDFVGRVMVGDAGFALSHSRHIATIKAMAAEPRLPAEPTGQMLAEMAKAHFQPLSTTTASFGVDQQRLVYRALYAHLQPKPATKEVEISLWVQLDERGKVIHCGPLGESCGASFEMKQEAPKSLSGNSIVFKGKATVPK